MVNVPGNVNLSANRIRVSTVIMNGGEAMKVSMDNNGAAWWVTIREPVGMPGVVTRFEYLAARDRAPRQGKRPDKR